MKKLNAAEEYMIIEGLKLYAKFGEKNTARLEKKGMNSLFAKGYFTAVTEELINKIKEE